MQWWPLFGLRRRLTERREYVSPVSVQPTAGGVFNRSFFVYVIDVGSSNALNFEISALESPQYNIHRFGIYMTDSPRHADVLLVLGRPTAAMLRPLEEIITQLPNPFSIVTIDDGCSSSGLFDYPVLPDHAAALEGIPSPSQLLGLLLDLSKTKRKRS